MANKISNYTSQARAAGTFANGGSQLPFRTQMGIYRQGNNGFSRNLEPGGVVLLGEELMLRAHVKFGDGKYLNKKNSKYYYP